MKSTRMRSNLLIAAGVLVLGFAGVRAVQGVARPAPPQRDAALSQTAMAPSWTAVAKLPTGTVTLLLPTAPPASATPSFTELQDYRDVVYDASTPEDFAECIKKAYSEDSPDRIKKRRARVARSSWDSKAELVLAELFKES